MAASASHRYATLGAGQARYPAGDRACRAARTARRQPDAGAEILGTSRPNVGRIAKEIDTLERYVEALGGKLEIHAIFDDTDIKLTA